MHRGDEIHSRPALSYLVDDAHSISIDSIEDLRDRFDPVWRRVHTWIDRSVPVIDRIVNSLTGILGPEAIVFGGQIPVKRGAMLIERVTFWDTLRYDVPPPYSKLVLSQTTGDATTIGASLVPLKESPFL